MADKPKNNSGPIPTLSPPRSEPSEFDKFVASNMDKAIIGNPAGDHGVTPLNASNAPPTPQSIAVPVGATAEQAAQIQAAYMAIMQGVPLTTTNPNNQGNRPAVVPPMRDVIVPDTQTRMWNPNQVFQPHAKLSDMEASVRGVNPTAVIAGSSARAESPLKAKSGTSPVLIDTYNLLNNLVKGKWFKFGAPIEGIETTLERLKEELEN